MTPVQIAYFKHYLFDSGIQAIYISMYRRNRIKGGPEGDKNGNPESLEEFLQQQPYFRVIMHAFYFNTNSQFGYDYWKDKDAKWKKYWEMHESNLSNDKYVTLKGTFAILRQNWDSSRYWKVESVEETYARMKMEPPIKLENEYLRENEIKAAPEENRDLIDFSDNFSDVPEANAQKENSEALLEGFSLVDTVNPQGGRKMSTNTVSVNMRNGGYRVTFSAKQSDRLRKVGYKFVKLLTKKETKEIALIFNNQSGCSVCVKNNKDSNSKNVTINSRDVVAHISKFYNIKDDYYRLEITATIQQDMNTIFKLKYLNDEEADCD